MSKPVLLLWCILSFLVSGLFIFYGLMLLQQKEIPEIDFFSAVVSLLYGVISIFLLAQTWAKPNEKYVTISKYVVLFMFFAHLILNVAVTGGLELASLLIVTIMLTTNWVSVKYVTEFKQ